MAEELADEFDDQPATPRELDLVRQLMVGKQALAISYLDRIAERHQARVGETTVLLHDLDANYDPYADDEGAQYEALAARLERELALIESIFGLERAIEAGELAPERVDRYAQAQARHIRMQLIALRNVQA